MGALSLIQAQFPNFHLDDKVFKKGEALINPKLSTPTEGTDTPKKPKKGLEPKGSKNTHQASCALRFSFFSFAILLSNGRPGVVEYTLLSREDSHFSCLIAAIRRQGCGV